MLIDPPDSGSMCLLESWEIKLNQPLPEILKRKVIDYISSTSTDTRTKEINYKLLTKWYYVPAKLHKILIFHLCAGGNAGMWEPMLIYGGNAL